MDCDHIKYGEGGLSLCTHDIYARQILTSTLLVSWMMVHCTLVYFNLARA